MSVAGKLVGGVFQFFKNFIGGGDRKPSYDEDNEEEEPQQSEKGAIRMKKFKTLAEETEYEECAPEKIEREVEYEKCE